MRANHAAQQAESVVVQGVEDKMDAEEKAAAVKETEQEEKQDTRAECQLQEARLGSRQVPPAQGFV